MLKCVGAYDVYDVHVHYLHECSCRAQNVGIFWIGTGLCKSNGRYVYKTVNP